MAEKLSIQIALYGGAEIEKQLAGIGEAGQKAFADIEQSAQQVGGFKNLKPEEVTAKLKAMGVEGTAAFDKIQKAVASASRLETLVQGIQAAETAMKALAIAAIPIGAAVVAGMVAATKATISFAESITKASEQAQKMGLSITEFDGMRLALEKAGVSAGNVTSFMQRLAAATEKADLGKVAKAAKELSDALSTGGFISGTSSLRIIKEAASGIGPAAVAARKALTDIGLAIPPDAKLSLDELITSTGSAEAGLRAFVEQLRQMPNAVQANKLAQDALGVSATQLITAYDQLKASGAGAITPDMVTNADAVTAAVNRLEAAFARLGTTAFAGVVVAELDAVTRAIDGLQSAINNFSWGTFADGAMAAGNALKYFTISGIASLAVVQGLKQLKNVFGGGAPATGGGKEPGGIPMASGGLLGGSGTGTSDSNLAWVSRGEHIMPARAVAQPGVLAFLEALRRSGGNLRSVLDGMGRFALGGMVPRVMPAFASGGLAGGMSNVTIQFPGLPAISGLRASSDVVDQLHKAAALAQVRSGGRKPSRYS